MASQRGLFQKLLGRWTDPEETPPVPAKTERTVRDNEVDILRFDGKEIRTVWIKDEQWWVATDVCQAIDLANASMSVRGLDPDERTTITNPDSRPGEPGAKNLIIVNEPGLYHLLSKSNKDKAKEFWRWVRHEVLPTIRRTGSYSVDQTPIRRWIKSAARKHGFGHGWQKKRQKIADGNRAADAQTFAIGGDAVVCSMRYNAMYSGLFGMVAKQLKKALGCREKDSPLSQMGDVPLSLYDTTNCLILQKMKDGSVPVEDLTIEAEATGKIIRDTAIGILGPGHDFRPVENQKGYKQLDVVQGQLPDAV